MLPQATCNDDEGHQRAVAKHPRRFQPLAQGGDVGEMWEMLFNNLIATEG